MHEPSSAAGKSMHMTWVQKQKVKGCSISIVKDAHQELKEEGWCVQQEWGSKGLISSTAAPMDSYTEPKIEAHKGQRRGTKSHWLR